MRSINLGLSVNAVAQIDYHRTVDRQTIVGFLVSDSLYQLYQAPCTGVWA